MLTKLLGPALGLLGVFPIFATVTVNGMYPTPGSPQVIGTSISWVAVASDSNPGPLVFQFNVAPMGGNLTLAQDFKPGVLNVDGKWDSRSFVWTPVGIDGPRQVQAVVKDTVTGETASLTVNFQVNPLATGSTPVVEATANPLVALFGNPSCAAGSMARVSFQPQSKSAPATTTPWTPCQPPHTMTFEIAGMYASTTYSMFAQTMTAGKITNGPPVSFTTGAIPKDVPSPPVTNLVAPGSSTDTTDWVMLHDLNALGGTERYPDVATDLAGTILWYYYAPNAEHDNLITRPLPGGSFLAIQSGVAWNPASDSSQLLVQIDLAGNIIRETNTGAIQQQLLALGSVDGGPCNGIPSPPPVGAACLDSFSHDAIQTLPGGYTAALVDVEKIFPPGTQGDTSGMPVDILGNMIVVLDNNWQVVWYWDAFEHDGGGRQLDINRTAVLGETCVQGQGGCPPMFLLGKGVAPQGHDWLHGNSLYYWGTDSGGASGDIVYSSRHQDWVMKIDFANGTGKGDILWRMGPCGDFAFNNINNDPWPWFSHQHEAGIESLGTGPISMFDNGNTRLSAPNHSTGCMPGVGKGDSRGMALTFNEAGRTVTPVISQDLGVISDAQGSAQLLSDGNWFFMAGVVLVNLNLYDSQSIEILPTAGTVNGNQVLNQETPEAYRGWQMPSLYAPPIT